MPLLSVIIPVYNEEKTIEKIIKIIGSLKIDKEIIAVNNASTDRTQEILGNIVLPELKIFTHLKNVGKGSAVKTGLKNAAGDIVILQDADLEYDPRDYPKLIYPIANNQADLILGARFTKGYKGLFLHRIGNRFLTSLLNLMYGAHISDAYTCYKVASRKIFNSFNLRSNDFSIDQEIILKALKMKARIREVPVSYYPRNYSEGKKIRIYDAFKMLVGMIKLKFTR